MTLYLILSILFSALLYVILKNFIFWKVETLHGIIINYFVAATCSFLMNPAGNFAKLSELNEVWLVTALIGFMFITVFFIIAMTTQTAGVAVASVASKMSMVIPITAGFFLYNESMHFSKIMGIVLAIPAVILTSKPETPPSGTAFKLNLKNVLFPVLLFVGAGAVDTAIKIAQNYFMNEDNQHLIIMAIFGFAGIIGSVRLFYELVFLRKKLLFRSIAGGIVLGVANYLSLYFLLKCLAYPGSESSTVFAIVNIGVVLTSFVAGLILFREKINKFKLIGISMAIIAIILLSK